MCVGRQGTKSITSVWTIASRLGAQQRDGGSGEPGGAQGSQGRPQPQHIGKLTSGFILHKQLTADHLTGKDQAKNFLTLMGDKVVFGFFKHSPCASNPVRCRRSSR